MRYLLINLFGLVAINSVVHASATPPVVAIESHFAGKSYLQNAVKYRLVYCVDVYCDRATVPAVGERAEAQTVDIVFSQMARALEVTNGQSYTEECGEVWEHAAYTSEELLAFLTAGEHAYPEWDPESLKNLRGYLSRQGDYKFIRHFVSEACNSDEQSVDHILIYSAKSGYVTRISSHALPESFTTLLRPYYQE